MRKLLKIKFFIFALLTTVALVNMPPTAKANNIQCSPFRAIYKPSSSYKTRDLDFTLIISSHPEMSYASFGPYFTFTAYDKKTGKKVSSLRMARNCSNGTVVCGLDAEAGQFAEEKNYQTFESSPSFREIALSKNFEIMDDVDKEAAYSLILPYTEYQFKKNIIPHPQNWDRYIKFYTPEKIIPNFTGFDVWILSNCDVNEHYDNRE
jgi:hypothetical protein